MIPARSRSRFPDPRRAPGDAPLAWGARWDVGTLLDAYAHGIFPWPAEDGEVYWWSPDPRAVIPLTGLHISRSLRRTLASGRFRCTADTAFAEVVAGCADRAGERGGPGGLAGGERTGGERTGGERTGGEQTGGEQTGGEQTWITPELRGAYVGLHEVGHAHSVEVWDSDGGLVGGLYGVGIGAAFMGESMFHRATDASKIAVVETVARLRAGGFLLFDAQLPTPHLASLGAVTVDRGTYLALLDDALGHSAVFPATGSGRAQAEAPE